ncbi:hypothetical protein D3C73_827770 [compost metagenome]
MQGLRRGIVPAVGVIRLQRRSIDGLRGIATRHHQPVFRRRLQLIGYHAGVIHAFLIQLAALATFRPDRQVFLHRYRENRRVFQAGEAIVVERLIATHAHIAESAPGIPLQRAGFRPVLESFFTEFQLVFGKAETGEIVINQNCHRLAKIGRSFADRQQHVVAVERRKGQAVTRQILCRDQPVGLQIVSQQRKIDTLEQPVGLGDA